MVEERQDPAPAGALGRVRRLNGKTAMTIELTGRDGRAPIGKRAPRFQDQ